MRAPRVFLRFFGNSPARLAYHKVRYDNDHDLQRKIIDAITTNETLFFRDSTPFDALKFKALPELIDARGRMGTPRTIRVWSAACSTGQEPYSIAMTLCDLIPDIDQWSINIMATDISDAVIEQAVRGRYSAHEIQRGMTDDRLHRYFRRDGSDWVVNDRIRSMVSFMKLNLIEPFPRAEQWDVIFCRNVAIYFQEEVQSSLFNRLADCLLPHGYLFVGASESLNRFGPRFQAQQHCRAVFYQPNQPYQRIGEAA